MSQIYLVRQHLSLVPISEEGELIIDRLPYGKLLNCDIKQPRNEKYHRKYFALLWVGFEYWSPPELTKELGDIKKNFESFRSDVIVAAGFYNSYISLDNQLKRRPKSISFAKMGEVEFQALFSATIQVLLNTIFLGYSEDQLRGMARERENRILSFA